MRELVDWVRGRLGTSRPLVVGVSGPQGCGKTTLTQSLCAELAGAGLRAVTVSIDDCYLTCAEQRRLAEDHPDNPFFQLRGYPGTHDIALGARLLDALRESDGTTRVPVYDKSFQAGRGDRLPEALWRRVALPLDIVFFEGWMVGFRPVDEQAIEDPAMRAVNRRLAAYQAWWSRLDALVQLKAVDYRYVLDWRVEAEARMRASGRGGMTDAEVRAYSASFLPAYALYLPTVRADRVVAIGRDRLPV